MICSNLNCNQQVDTGASYCSACGTPTKKSGATESIFGSSETTPTVEPNSSSLEELKKQKEYLLLQLEIAKLEGKSNLGNRVDRWSWKWVAPLGLIASFFFIVFISEGPYVMAILALVAICPAFLKILKLLHVIG